MKKAADPSPPFAKGATGFGMTLAVCGSRYLGALGPELLVGDGTTGLTLTAGAARPVRRISAASSLISVRSRCISLQPYHNA